MALEADERLNPLAATLRQTAESSGIDLARPCVALDYRAVFLKRRPLVEPGARKRRARRANQEHMRWEVEQVLGRELEDFSVDSALVGDYGFAVAVRCSVLEAYQELFARAGVDDLDFDIEPFALYNIAEEAGALAGAGRVLLVGQDAGGAHVLLVEDGELREVARAPLKGAAQGRLADALEQCAGRFCGEEGDEGEFVQMWIAGTDAPQLCAALGERFDAPCAPLAPLAGVDATAFFGELEVDSAYAVAAGLAFRRLNE
jgi:Tfp pilus assembly PilM family ATPase